MNGWFIVPCWLFYFIQFVSVTQVALIDGIAKVVGMVLEIPSGTISDYFGKRLTILFGSASIIISCLVIIQAQSFTGLLIGNIIMFIGFSLHSGAFEALLYDYIQLIKQEDHYDEVLGKTNSIALFSTICSIFIGGFLYGLHPSYPFIAWAIFSLLSIVILCLMDDVNIGRKSNKLNYLQTLQDGITSIFKQPKLSFTVPVLLFSAVIMMYQNATRQVTGQYFGFDGETLGYVIGIVAIAAMFISYHYHKIQKLLKDRIEYLCIGIYLIAFSIILLTNTAWLGVVFFFYLYVAEKITQPYIISLINKYSHEHHRATSISTVNLFAQFPYIFITLGMPFLLELHNLWIIYSAMIIALCGYLIVKFFNHQGS